MKDIKNDTMRNDTIENIEEVEKIENIEEPKVIEPKQPKKIETKQPKTPKESKPSLKPSPITESYLITSIQDTQIILSIDGFSVLYKGKIPSDFTPSIGKFITIKHYGKNQITKELKDPEIIIT